MKRKREPKNSDRDAADIHGAIFCARLAQCRAKKFALTRSADTPTRGLKNPGIERNDDGS